MAYEVELDSMLLAPKLFSVDDIHLTFDDMQMECTEVTAFAYGTFVSRTEGLFKNQQYHFQFKDSASDELFFSFSNPHHIDLKAEDVYEKMCAEIWNAIGNRIYTQAIGSIISGQSFRVSDATFSRNGMTLEHHPLFGTKYSVTIPWNEIEATQGEGNLYLKSAANPKDKVALNLRTDYNALIVLRIFEGIEGDPSFVNVLSGK